MGRLEKTLPCGDEIVVDRPGFDARAWNTGEIAGTPTLIVRYLGAALCKLSARRQVVLISTSEI